jgi:hypothetical protein
MINFETVKNYLDAIADANGLIANSPHQRFWRIPYANFIKGNVPHVSCEGKPVPIIDQQDPANSPFLLILLGGWCGNRQMPGGGPHITEEGYEVPLPDGSVASGEQIRDDLMEWLAGGFPE